MISFLLFSNIWKVSFSKLLEYYPDFNLKKHSYKLMTCLEVPCAFDFKGKGVVRTMGGFLRDFLRLDIYRIYRRIPVLLNEP